MEWARSATSWLQLAQSDELKLWERKRGGFYQHDTHPSLVCSFLDEKRVRLLHGNERLGRRLLHSLGVDCTSLRLAATKLLRTSKGERRQEIHYDIPVYAQVGGMQRGTNALQRFMRWLQLLGVDPAL